MVQEVIITVQGVLEEIASFGERIKKWVIIFSCLTMIWTEAEPRGSRWLSSSKNGCKVQQDKLASPTTASCLTVFYSKKPFQSTGRRRSSALYWCSFHICLIFCSCLFVMGWGVMDAPDTAGDVGTEAPGISFLSHPRKWLLMVNVAFPTPSPSWPGCGGYQSLVSLASTLIFFCLCHFELSASCWKPKGGFQGLMAKREAQRVFLTLQRREVKSQKKKKKPPIQTHTNLLWLGLYWSLIDPYCCLFWTQSDGLWPSLTLMRSWVQAKNTATTCAVVTPQLGWKWPKDVFQSMNRALFCPAAWQEGSKRFKHY